MERGTEGAQGCFVPRAGFTAFCAFLMGRLTQTASNYKSMLGLLKAVGRPKTNSFLTYGLASFKKKKRCNIHKWHFVCGATSKLTD